MIKEITMNKISISIPGSNGRMGKTLLSLILESSKYEIASATCLPNEEEVGTVSYTHLTLPTTSPV